MDPPGHTVFLYLQELNRADLQKQAKLYGIKANQKSEVLRRELQRVLEEKDNVKSPAQSVVVVEEEETRDDVGNMEVKVVDVDASTVLEEEQQVVEVVIAPEEQHAVAPTNEEEQQQQELEQPSTSTEEVENEDEGGEEEETSASGSDVEMEPKEEEKEVQGESQEELVDATQEETENEESSSTQAPLRLVVVDTDNPEMADLADESIASPITTAKELYRSKIPSGRGARQILGERSVNSMTRNKNYESKLDKPRRYFQPSNISMIIRTKNSPPRRATTKNSQPILVTQTNPRPKQMPLSKRNELQLQKFIERQNRGRKNREDQLKRSEFANMVRSPGRV